MINVSGDILDGLTDQQLEAVNHTDGPLLILAGAGSGKTRVVTRRIARMVRDGVRPESILAITFTNKAAGEMRERVGFLLGTPLGGRRGADESSGPTVATFHAFAVRLLRQYADRLGLDKRFSILDAGDQLALIRQAAVAAKVDVQKHRPQDLAHLIGRAKERMDDEGFVASAYTEVERAAAATLPGYRELQLSRSALDFEDLVSGAVTLLSEHEEVAAQVHARLKYICVDEYQDTNHSQYRLARLLAGERRNLAVVGDPDQSIYGWRGADMGNILRFEEDYPGARVIFLEHNYRSTATILAASNHLIGHNTVRREKVLRPTGAEGSKIDVLPCLDAEQEADAVARRIGKAIQAGVPPHEIAIIYRASIHARAYEDALLQHGVACAQVGGTSFFDRSEVKDALAFVRLAINENDDMAALRALKLTRRIGKRSLEKVHEFQRNQGISVLEACRRADHIPGLTPDKRGALGSFAGLIRELTDRSQGTSEDLIVSAIGFGGLDAPAEPGDARGEARQGNLRRLIEAARGADKRAEKGGGNAKGRATRELIDRLALLDAQDKDDGGEGRVVLTTVHASKGLEFDWVFCVGLEEGLFPHYRSIQEGNLEEERRLAYVAFTRARQQLVLSYAQKRASRNPNLRDNRRPSPFLYELPIELLWDPVLREPMELTPQDATPAPPAPLAKPAKTARTAKSGAKKPKLWSQPLVVASSRTRT